MRVKSLVKQLGASVVRRKTGPVAITIHHITANEFDWMNSFFLNLEKKYEFIDPIEARSRESLSSTSVLVTLDDGLKSQKRLADQVLKPMGIKAAFFVPTAFVGLSGREARAFAKERFFPKNAVSAAAGKTFDAMSWDELRELHAQGHTIGAHTHTHPMLSELTTKQQQWEIVDSANMLSRELGCEVTQFAYPFGSLGSVNEASVKLAGDRFEVCYSNIRGMLSEQNSHTFLYRQNIVPGVPINEAIAAVEGRLDWRYRGARKAASVYG